MIEQTLASAIILHKSGHIEEAEKQYQQLITENPKNADAQHLLGILWGQQGRFKEALAPLHAALALEPDSSSFHNSLGNVEKHLGHTDQAIFHYQKALKSPSASSAVHNNLGTLYHLKKQWPEAISCYQKAIEIRADYADAHYNLANTLTELNQYSAAIIALNLTLKHQPNHLPAIFHLAQLHLQQQNPEQAIQHYEHCLTLAPNHVEAHHQLAVALTQQNRTEEAITHYQQTLTLHPKHQEALHNLGAIYVVQQKPALALPCYLKLLEFQADFDTYYNIGVIYLHQNKHDDAITYLDEALKLEPQAFNVYVNLGAVYLKKEAVEKAIFYYEQALLLKPEDPELLYILAALCKKSTPAHTPKAYIEHLFDQYAPHFDQHLTQQLNYRVPDLLLKAAYPILDKNLPMDTVLDLGCGTGLCGEKFRPYTKKMIGIDLSENMLSIAREKKIYDILENISIDDALQKYTTIDFIIAGDVFGYVGDLDRTFLLAAKALKKQGHFIFSTEKTWEADFELQTNARFSHHPQYIKTLAQKYEFDILHHENAIIRQQKEKPLAGIVWMLVK